MYLLVPGTRDWWQTTRLLQGGATRSSGSRAAEARVSGGRPRNQPSRYSQQGGCEPLDESDEGDEHLTNLRALGRGFLERVALDVNIDPACHLQLRKSITYLRTNVNLGLDYNVQVPIALLRHHLLDLGAQCLNFSLHFFSLLAFVQ